MPLAEAECPVRELAPVRHADGPARSPTALDPIATIGGEAREIVARSEKRPRL